MKSIRRWVTVQSFLPRSCFKVAAVLLLLLVSSLKPVQAERISTALSQNDNAEMDVFLKPLVDTSQNVGAQASGNPFPLRGQASRRILTTPGANMNVAPLNTGLEPLKPTQLITGKVQTLQQAIQSESETVDWYGWYLAARAYLAATGGIRCPLGTEIKFYRSGYMEALSSEPSCLASLMGRRFALPAKTRLDALILPVRSGSGPAASKQEIYSRVNALQYQ